MLAPQIFDDVVELGVIPVGAPKTKSSYMQLTPAQWKSMADTDWVSPNIERILQLKPDLILTASFDKANYPLYSHIAPTVMIDITTYGDWRNRFYKIAKVLGKTTTAEQLMQQYELHSKRVRQEIKGKNYHVFVLSATSEAIAVEPQNYFCWNILHEVGLSSPLHFRANGRTPQIVSWERIREFDGDALYIVPAGFGGEERTDAALRLLKSQPLWSSLNAVRNHHVYPVGAYWFTGGPTSAERILTDLEYSLLSR